jgi:hypothetical protein
MFGLRVRRIHGCAFVRSFVSTVAFCSYLLSQSQQQSLVALDFFLQLNQSEQECFGRWRTTGHVNVNWNNAITTTHHRIGAATSDEERNMKLIGEFICLFVRLNDITAKNIQADVSHPPTQKLKTHLLMIIASTIGTRSHGHHPSRFWHLIINFAQCRSHFVRQCPGDNHDIGLSWRRAKDHTESIHIVATGRGVHHFHGTTCQAKRHGPQRALAGPVD